MLTLCSVPSNQQYLGDVDGGVMALTQAKQWREALRVSYLHSRDDLVDTLVIPAAADSSATLLAEAADAVERIVKYHSRLKEVRAKRVAMEAAVATAEAEPSERAGWTAVDDDVVSEAFSEITGMSAYTDGTAATSGAISASRPPSTVGGRRALKSDRKAAKRGRIKQGSPAEESALCTHLAGLSPAKHNLEDAGQLAELLCLLGHLQDARLLQQRVAEWQQAYANAMDDISAHPVPAIVGLDATSNVLKQQQAGAPLEEVHWKWDILRSNH